jgi:hypothetical protein
MKRISATALLPAVLSFALAGCEAQKSSNPLSPSVAGPIAGVEITAPKLVEPGQGFKYKESQQPIRLVIENATSTGVRPISYMFEVASDADFTSKVFARNGVPGGDGGRTVVQVDRLDIGRAYYWRARAEDGANSGQFASAQFEVLPRPFLDAPGLVSPINNERVDSRRPTLTVSQSARNAAIGTLGYEFQVAIDQGFGQVVSAGVVEEQGRETRFTPNGDLAADRQHFWRVRASDGEATSQWAATQTFRTQAGPAPGPGPGPSPGPGGGNCDALVNGDRQLLVECIHATILPRNEHEAFEVTKRVAWALRAQGGGLLIKNGGENIVSWQGYSFSAGRVCFPDGHIYKIISDVGPGGANGPQWADNDFVDRSLYVPAIDPSRR